MSRTIDPRDVAQLAGNRGNAMATGWQCHRHGLDRGVAGDFLDQLAGGLTGCSLILAARPGERPRPFRCPRPGVLPSLPEWAESPGVNLWATVCTFTEPRRLASLALEVPAAWADLDPPDGIEAEDLATWRSAALGELTRARPSLIVDSGRGLHGYWLLRPPARLEGPNRQRLVALVEDVNRALAARLGGDAVGDLARVMRLAGSWNPKVGAGACRMLLSDGPRYQLEDLVDELRPEMLRLAPKTSTPAPVRQLVSEPSVTCRRGRPSLGVTRHDLRSLPRWARSLVEGGVWRAGARYARKGGRGLDRSRADLAAIGALVRAGWTDAKIAAAFWRLDWNIGSRYRDLLEREGEGRAAQYLSRQIGVARAGEQDMGSKQLGELLRDRR